MNNTFSNIFDLIQDFRKTDEYHVGLILDIKNEFTQKYEEEKEKLPYNLNLLDEIRASENEHSRIFVKIIQYKYNKKYIFLESFLQFLGPPFSELKISDPIISAEKNRIDIGIKEANFSIIIENKIWGALDQPGQIKRYIEKEEKEGYKFEYIFILYLTSQGGSPSEESLPSKIMEEFKARYREINYKDHIVYWLREIITKFKKTVEDKEKVGDEILESALIQYMDFLDGYYFERKGVKEMKKAMIERVTKELHLDEKGDILQQVDRINDYLTYIEKLKEVLEDKKSEIVFSKLEKYKNELCNQKVDGINNVFVVDNTTFGEEDSSVGFRPDGWKERYHIGVGFEKKISGLFYGIFDKEGRIDIELNKEISKYLGDCEKPSKYWPCWKYIYEGEEINELLVNIENGTLTHFLKERISEIINKTKKIDAFNKNA